MSAKEGQCWRFKAFLNLPLSAMVYLDNFLHIVKHVALKTFSQILFLEQIVDICLV